MLCALAVCSLPIRAAADSLVVIYPKPNQVISSVDSTFLFGHIQAAPEVIRGYQLTINGASVPVHADGGFLAFLPIRPGAFLFRLQARHEGNDRRVRELSDSLQVLVPEPVATLADSTFEIRGDYRPPSGDLVLRENDRLDISFHGTPGRVAWCRIPGAVDSLPLHETPPRFQPYWGEAVFGNGKVPDSLLIRGIYAAFWKIPDSVQIDTTRIRYFLGPRRDTTTASAAVFEQHRHRDSVVPGAPDVRVPLSMTPGDADSVISRESGYRVSLNSTDYPFVARMTDTVQIVRHAPRQGYLAIAQPLGTLVLVDGAEGDWYRVRLSETQVGWVAKGSISAESPGTVPPRSYPSVVRTRSFRDSVRVECSLAAMHPFQVRATDDRQFRIRLFGVTSNIDWIRYDFSDSLISRIDWEQIEPGLLELRLDLTQRIWGYDNSYDGSTFVLTVHKAPAQVGQIAGKRIMIDPGHSSDNGAVGPTGYTEKEANLAISLELADMLRKKGAIVSMTRSDTSHIPLAARPVLARKADADLFVSIHNNALPDGVNPFVNNGVATFYYHPQSLKLAKAIQHSLLEASIGSDYGLYHGNLLVNRATQYPAVLVECAFMMIPEQEAALKTPAFRHRVARAITSGIETFLREYAHER